MIINNDEFFAKVLEVLGKGQSATIPVKGFSMLPFIRGEKDLVVLSNPDRPYREGDIVLFRYCGRYVMHRIISAGEKKVVIMGDGVPKSTETVTREDICGLVTQILRRGKRKVDPFSACQQRRARIWRKLLPVRGYLLAIYRRLPWNWFWLRRQYAEARTAAMDNNKKQEYED